MYHVLHNISMASGNNTVEYVNIYAIFTHSEINEGYKYRSSQILLPNKLQNIFIFQSFFDFEISDKGLRAYGRQ